MAEIARRATAKHNQVLFMIHRKEVLDQTFKTFRQQNVDYHFLTAGMVQTLTRKVSILPTPALILIDEGHHALAKSYQRILKAFPSAYVLLFTATPHRTGRKQLDQIADDLIVGKSIKELTKEGFLAPYVYYSVPYSDVDRKKLKRSSTGDYTKKSMDQAISTKIYSHTVDEYLSKARGMQAVVYTYSVRSAKRLAKQFQARNISAAEVDGDTPTDKRDEIVQAFRDQQLNVLVNVDLFTEGIDLPNVDCVIMVRPTKSLSLYMQFSMRCLNPRKGKTAVIIDQVANYQEFGTPNADRDWHQLFKTTSKTKRRKSADDNLAIVQCQNCFAVLNRSEVKNNTCPVCGFKPIIQHSDPKITDAKLSKIGNKEGNLAIDFAKIRERKKRVLKLMENSAINNVADKTIGQLRNLTEFRAYAKLHNYSSGWAWIMWNKKKKGIL